MILKECFSKQCVYLLIEKFSRVQNEELAENELLLRPKSAADSTKRLLVVFGLDCFHFLTFSKGPLADLLLKALYSKSG